MKLEFIKDKVKQACPEIKKQIKQWEDFGCNLDSLPCDPEEAFGEYPDNFGFQFTLSHVLRTIKSKEEFVAFKFDCVDQHGTKETHLAKIAAILLDTWNLTKPLDEQSEEVINFLYDILK